MAEQMMRLRLARVRRPRRDDPGGQQAGQREAGRYQHRHRRAVTESAVDGDQRRGHDSDAERRAALPGGG